MTAQHYQYSRLLLLILLYLAFTSVLLAQSQWEIYEQTNIQGTISGSIKKGLIFKTVSGNIYEVTDHVYLYKYEYHPSVMVLKSGNLYKLIISGIEDQLNCRKLNSSASPPNTAMPAIPGPSGIIESQIEGEFNGWDGETIFKLGNGQVWQQASYAYMYHYAYRPKVMIFQSGGQWRMKVENVNSTIFVRRLR